MSSRMSIWRMDKNSISNLLNEKKMFKSMRWMHTSQSSFSESFFLVFIWGYFLCHHRLQCDQKIPSLFPQKQCYQTDSSKKSCITVSLINTSKSSLSICFFLVSIWGYFLCHNKLQYTRQYPIVESRKIVLANW